jgi:hypothetical protein
MWGRRGCSLGMNPNFRVPLERERQVYLIFDDLCFNLNIQRRTLIGTKVGFAVGALTQLYSLRLENIPPSTLRRSNPILPAALSPATSFSRLLLSQDIEPQLPLVDLTANEQNQVNRGVKKIKKTTRLLLDARTELTDDELKVCYGQPRCPC